MSTSKVWRIMVTMMAAVLVLSSFAVGVSAATETAPVAQELRAQEVKGTIPGGQSAEIWLGLETVTPGEKITIVSTWDRSDPRGNGLGFYVLTDQHKTEVLSGTDPRLANLATGSAISPESLENEVGAEFQATSEFFTLIVYNDSPNDGNFTIKAENAFITDGSDQVEDANAEMDEDMSDDAGEEAGDEAEGDAEADAGEEAAPAEEEAEEPAEEEVATPEPVEEEEDAEETEAEPAPAPVGTPGVVEAQELTGELPEQDDQHFLGLEPSVKDGTMNLVMSFNPQDSSELSSRIGFWVLDQDAFNRYLNPNENVVLSQVAIAAGSGDQPGLASNERSASFTASGFGPYTVVTYNNSSVPATYNLRVDGGMLIDDSGQTMTAMKSMEATETMTDTVETEAIELDEADGGEADAAPADDEADETDETDETPARVGDPGDTYTVQPGDSLSLIAGDIYGDYGYWEDICSFNNLSDCNNLEVGDTLQLPTRDQLGTGATSPTATTTEPAEAPEADATEDVATEDVAAEEPAEDEEPAADTSTETTADATEPVTATTGVTTTTEVETTDEMTDTAESETEAATPGVDILTMLEAQGGMTILIDALKAASLDDTLMKDPGPFTIFAPTDAAFEATLPNYEDLFGNPAGTLTELLLYHIVSDSELAASDIGDGMQAATAHQALPVKFEITDDGLKIQDSVITKADVQASNGIVHIIDKVMIPSDISQ